MNEFDFCFDKQVLVSDCILEWVACTAPCRLPPGSIQAGKTKDGEPLYIARAPHRDSMTPGKFQLSKQVYLWFLAPIFPTITCGFQSGMQMIVWCTCSPYFKEKYGERVLKYCC